MRNASPGGVPFGPLRPMGTPSTFDGEEEVEGPASGEETETPSPDAEGMPIPSDVDGEEGLESASRPDPSPEVPVPAAESEPHRADDAGESDEAVEIGGAEEPPSVATLTTDRKSVV